MRTSVCESAWVFIVERADLLFLGVEVFSLSESSWAYFTGSFPYRSPLGSMKRGEQVIYLYMQTCGIGIS